MGSSITIHREQIQDFRELKVTGRLDSGTTPQLSQALEEEVKAGHNRVMLNLLEVEFLSSAAIRVLLQYYKECRKRQGILVFSPLQRCVRP
jgi:anti-anti-sigma factor